ncbi:MAG: 30S ribosomal protein S6, partial [Deltaproteobacteria bacterium]|nr:30S ribosomal protein S6 [Deltaproteobacteria bacterium]
MRRYETITIIDPDLSDEERAQVLERTTNLIPKEGGFLIML